MPSRAAAVTSKSRPASTTALSLASGAPAMVNGTPLLPKASAVVGTTSPKAWRQPAMPRAVTAMPLANPTTVAARRPSVVKVVSNVRSPPVSDAAPPCFPERVGVEIDVSHRRERLDRRAAQEDRIADLAERLRGVSVVVGARGVEEAGERDGGTRIDVVPGVGGAAAHAQRAELSAAIEREVDIIDRRRGGARVEVDRGTRIAARKSEPPMLGNGGVKTADETADRPVEGRGIAVALGPPPGANCLGPGGEHRLAWGRRRRAGLVDRLLLATIGERLTRFADIGDGLRVRAECR